MNMLILNLDQQAALAALNQTGDPSRQLQPVPVDETRAALNADLLQDCGSEQTWAHYAAFLQSLPAEEIIVPALPPI